MSLVRWSGGGWAWVRLGKIKCAAICVGLCVGLQLFLFCEGLAFCRPISARMFDVGTVVLALQVTT